MAFFADFAFVVYAGFGERLSYVMGQNRVCELQIIAILAAAAGFFVLIVSGEHMIANG